MTFGSRALELHRKHKGKLEIKSKVPLRTVDDLSLVYTPGVAEACREIARDAAAAYRYTVKGNLIAVVSDGTAVLGLGDIGPLAALPVMEGKCLLFKALAGIDAIPVCIGTKDVLEIVQAVKWLEPTLGGVNLEDISAPRCFEIERRLKKETGIPIFHDDQHGTAVTVLAAVLNALRLAGKELEAARIVVSGAGAAGIAVANLLMNSGARDVVMGDIAGLVHAGRQEEMDPFKEETAARGNVRGLKGTLADAMVGADVLIGLSAPSIVTPEMVGTMAPKSVVLAMANPVPEIFPQEAKAGGAFVVGSGRSDFPNQVNNVLAFPGIMRGALDTRAKDINEAMKLAASRAIADLVSTRELSPDYIIPGALDGRVGPAVAKAVARAAMDSGVARVFVDPDKIYSDAPWGLEPR